MTTVRKGTYKHFKGNTYRVVGTARHSETLEELVVYSKLNNPDDLWVRPMASFVEKVLIEGTETDRFLFIEE